MNSFNLKLLALITMIIDHIGIVFFPQYYIFRYIGRFSFPIFAFFLAEGARYTKNYISYLKRLLIFALISEIFFDLIFSFHLGIDKMNFFEDTNTMYTLFISALSIYIFENTKNKILKFALMFLTINFAYFLSSDYGVWGVLFILIFYFIKDRKKLLLCSSLWVISRYLYYIFLVFKENISNPENFNYIYNSVVINIFLLIFTLIPLVFIYIYKGNNHKEGNKGKYAKWLFYIGYPMHLAIIYLIELFVESIRWRL